MSHPDPNRAVQRVEAPREAVWRAFMDPDALVEWLPPAPMTGRIHAFDGSVGGGYEMSLFYPPEEQDFRGKTAEREDRVKVRFVALSPPEQIVEAVTFASDEPAFQGEMTLTIDLSAQGDATEVAMTFANLPSGLNSGDNAEGARLSLQQLARRIEGNPPSRLP